MRKNDNKPLAAVIGATFVTSLSATAAHADENPFALKDLASGYLADAGKDQAKPKKEAMCGAEVMKNNPEMKCGASMMKMEDMPQQQQKATEGKCAGMKKDTAPTPPPSGKAPKVK